MQRGTGSATSDGAHFVLASDFWLYIVVTTPFVGLTLLLVVWMNSRAARMG
jgi:hypothetical protein